MYWPRLSSLQSVAGLAELVRILSALTKRDTQFIAITHSRRTMEAADILYGVTMEEAGCSRLVSVNFAEVEA